MTVLPAPVTIRDHIECAIVDAYFTITRPFRRARNLPSVAKTALLEWRYRYYLVRRWLVESWHSKPILFGDGFEDSLVVDYLGAVTKQEARDNPLGVIPVTLGYMPPESLN